MIVKYTSGIDVNLSSDDFVDKTLLLSRPLASVELACCWLKEWRRVEEDWKKSGDYSQLQACINDACPFSQFVPSNKPHPKMLLFKLKKRLL